MSITRFDPFYQLNQIQDQMSKVFENSLSHSWDETAHYFRTWCPVVDILETEDYLFLKAELPGLTDDDVDVCIENNTLTLKGERKLEQQDKKADYHRKERFYGTFLRSFTLDSNVEQSKVTAEFNHGVLEIKLPKREESKPKQIKVKSH